MLQQRWAAPCCHRSLLEHAATRLRTRGQFCVDHVASFGRASHGLAAIFPLVIVPRIVCTNFAIFPRLQEGCTASCWRASHDLAAPFFLRIVPRIVCTDATIILRLQEGCTAATGCFCNTRTITRRSTPRVTRSNVTRSGTAILTWIASFKAAAAIRARARRIFASPTSATWEAVAEQGPLGDVFLSSNTTSRHSLQPLLQQ